MGRGSVWIPVVGTVCVLALGGTAWISSSQAPVRERLERFVAEYDAKQAEPPPRREALYGETVHGSAFEQYAVASQELARHRLQWRREGPHTRLNLTAEERTRFATSLAAGLKSVRVGARCDVAQRGAHAMNAGVLALVVGDALQHAFATGDDRTGVELFLDRCAFLIDAGSWHSDAVWFCDDWLQGIAAETAVFFADSLRRLDGRCPRFSLPDGRIARAVTRHASLTPMQQTCTDGLHAWRYGFDSHWRDLVFCDGMVARLCELQPPADDWRCRQLQLGAFGDCLADEEPNSLVARIPASVKGQEVVWRHALTSLRFLRLAVAFVHGHELPRLDDPLGSGPIEVEIRGDEATLRSEGTNGKERLERTVRRQ